MPQRYTIRQGDHAAAVAARFGFRSFQTIWQDGLNADLRATRTNTNVLLPGDVLVIPDKELRVEARPTGARHEFVAVSSRLRLRVRLLDLVGEPLRNQPCTLTVAGTDAPLTTDGEGVLTQEIQPSTSSAMLQVGEAQYPLRIGDLDPVDTASGATARLANLGYLPDFADAELDPQELVAAVEEFQLDHGLTLDGLLAGATLAKLEEVHGS